MIRAIKAYISISLLISLLFFVNCASANKTNSTSKSNETDKKIISENLHNYIKAFKLGDYSIFQKTVSTKYIKDNGGENHWKKILRLLKPKYKNSKLQNITIHFNKANEAYANYEVVKDGKYINKMKNTWFLLKKKDKTWKISALVHDFDPTEEVR